VKSNPSEVNYPMKRLPISLLAALAILTVARGADKATVDIKDKNGATIGTATLTPVDGGVRVVGQVSGLSKGKHGIHIHDVGSCTPPDFKSAGDHFNPTHKHHGMKNPQGPHAGDLGNLVVGDDGKGEFDVVAANATLGDGPNSLFHKGGTSLVIHAKEDDEMSDPSGNSGDRIACGVIARE
jgi:Cu-Zn family superoxide dismutase